MKMPILIDRDNPLDTGMFYADGAPGGRVYCELMQSETFGRNWTRLAPRQPFIPPGPAGTYDDHTCYSARPMLSPSNPAATMLYYAGGNGPHSGARSDFIALATVQTNAYAGLKATDTARPWVLQTVALEATGTQLVVNVLAANRRASLLCSVRNSGHQVATANISLSTTASAIRTPVGLDVPLVIGQSYVFYFTAQGALTLFSLEFV